MPTAGRNLVPDRVRSGEGAALRYSAGLWMATPSMTIPIPARSTSDGSWASTITPISVATAGSSDTNSAYVARGRRAIASCRTRMGSPMS